MPRALQLRLNLSCVVRDVLAHDWRKVRFHWAGVVRAVNFFRL